MRFSSVSGSTGHGLRVGSSLGRNADRQLLSSRTHATQVTPDDLEAIATRAGRDWADAFTGELRRQHRAIAGAWPGTMTEARAHVLTALAAGARAISIEEVRALSRTAYRAARLVWSTVAQPDQEEP
jgi:hypothetical protein